MNPDNQAILAAILGTGAAQPTTTLNPGVASNEAQITMGGQAQQPMQNNAQMSGNPVHMNTIQSFFSGPQSTFNQNPLTTPTRHSIGKDSWSSGMGLDHQSILNNIGLGGQNNG